jgi:hypothetical protein
MYILGAFDGLIKENRLKMREMSSSKTVSLFCDFFFQS